METHAAGAAELLGDAALVRAVLDDFRTAPIGDADKALFAYIHKLNLEPSAINDSDVDQLRAAGWSDEAVYDAVTVCALFNFYNRWVDGTGDHKMPAEGYAASGRRIARDGYSRS